jgi:acetylornithine deacetylase
MNLREACSKASENVRERDVVSLAEKLVSIPSFTGEETALARFLEEYFAERGYDVEMQEVERGRLQPVARLKGAGGGRSLMLNGHMDVDALTLDAKDPFTCDREGTKLWGWGLWNMKGGLTSMIIAAEAVRESGVSLKGDLILTPVVGELQGGVGTSYLLEHGIRADMGIVPEPWGAHIIITKHAGMVQLAVNIKGRHSFDKFGSPPEGVDAFDKMLKVVQALKKVKLTYEPWPIFPDLPFVEAEAEITVLRAPSSTWTSVL